MLTEINSENSGIAETNAPAQLRVKILGVGSGATATVSQLAFGGYPLERIVLDTSATDLTHAPANANTKKFLFGEAVTHGLGAGTNSAVGEKSARSSETELREILAGTDLLFIVAMLGRGTGSGAAPFIAELARELGITTISFATTPFSYEGKEIIAQAMNAAEKLHAASNAFVLVENDLVSQASADLGCNDGFKLSGSWIEKGVEACCAMLFSENAGARIDFGTFKSVFPLCGTPTLFALGNGRGETAVNDALNEIFHCPFLNTRSAAAHSDTLVIHLRAGSEPTISVANEISQRIRGRFGGNDRTLTCTTIVPELGNALEICILGAGEIRRTRRKLNKVVSATSDSVPNIFADALANEDEIPATHADAESPLTQGELFDDPNRGVFQAQRARLYDGQDLDSPTYIRRQCNLQKILDQKRRELQR